SFNRDIRPILSENCFACHGFDPKHREGDLRLDTFEGATEDRDGARGIVPGDLSKSDAWQRIISEDKDEVMPPPKSHKPPLTAKQRETIKAWIEQGAKYEAHWAFIPPQKPGSLHPPTANPIDYYIEKKLTEENLKPSPEADPATLIRRVFLDLTGLPPSPSDLSDLSDWSDQKYTALVNRLLSSKHYGERWGRWWLDQARYADSNGYSIDAPRQIWKFRDWVIDALNKDMPFDQFTIEQLAGDLLPKAKESQIIATGFHRNTQINQEGGIDKEQFRIDSVFDRVATTGSVWLGLTIGCAQCHDHKFDPIAHKEYYQMFAFLNNQDEPELKVFDPKVDVKGLTAEFKEVESKIKAYMKEHAADLDAWEAGITPAIKKSLNATIVKILGMPKAKRGFVQNQTLFAASIGGVGPFRELNDRHKELDTLLNKGTTTLVMKETAKPRKTTVFIKGDFTRPDVEVQPGTPAVLHPFETTSKQPNRLDLAKWIMSPKNPLTARVIVNRVWQQYFGRGIVETENDFGSQGTLPSHPELLDWLATELMAKKWSLKELHKLIVTSKTYRQSSANRPDLMEKDPQNYFLARQSRLRLDAEVVRDVCLAASGLLSTKIGGPPVYPPIPDGVMGQGQVKRVWSVSKGEDRYRRGLYTFVYRASPPPSLTVFDAPEGFSSCTRRIRSNTPLQALTLMNDSGFFEFATALKKIIDKDGLETAFKRCTARAPKPDELAVLKKLDSLNAARTLLNLDETVTRE
ncbi:MAG: PSD1 and planctomycete cytochrome C domain-containing protein, partial [Prosthecobacter sp.]